MRMQSHLSKCGRSIRTLVHHAPGVVLIFGYYYFIDGTEVKVGEHVASRETRDQKILGIVACRVTAERRIRGPKYRRLSGSCDRIVALISRVCLCALTFISGPRNLNLVVVLFHDLSSKLFRPDANYLCLRPEFLTQILLAGIAEYGDHHGLLPLPQLKLLGDPQAGEDAGCGRNSQEQS